MDGFTKIEKLKVQTSLKNFEKIREEFSIIRQDALDLIICLVNEKRSKQKILGIFKQKPITKDWIFKNLGGNISGLLFEYDIKLDDIIPNHLRIYVDGLGVKYSNMYSKICELSKHDSYYSDNLLRFINLYTNENKFGDKNNAAS